MAISREPDINTAPTNRYSLPNDRMAVRFIYARQLMMLSGIVAKTPNDVQHSTTPTDPGTPCHLIGIGKTLPLGPYWLWLKTSVH